MRTRKRFILVTIIFLASVYTNLFAIELETIRTNYIKAVSNKAICKQMIDELSDQKSKPVDKAYLGAFETIWAKYTSNPLSKLKTFNKGRDNIDQALASDPDNIEIRFIRLSIQKNCPSFLGYSDSIESDTVFLKEHIDEVKSSTLKQMINQLLG